MVGKSTERQRSYGECEQQPNAGCFTHVTAAKSEAWYCASSVSDCEVTARTLSRDPERAADYENISSCESWE